MLLKLKLHWQILIAMVLAVLAGRLTGVDGEFLGLRFYDVYVLVGTLFLNALKMIIVPLIVSSIIMGISSIGKSEDIGRLGFKSLSFFMLSTLMAILIGLASVNLIQPGIDNGKPVGELLALSADTPNILQKVEGHSLGDFAGIFTQMIPTNIFQAAAEGQMLGLIIFSLLFGYFMSHIGLENNQVLTKVTKGIYETMMAMTLFIMRFAPLGVFALVAKTVATTGFDAFVPLAWFFISVVLALAFHIFIAYPLILILLGRVSPKKHFQAMMPALLTAFSTASSSATLPLTIKCIEENAGVSKRTSSFVLPLGATINMDGTALYECVVVMFLLQAYGHDLNIAIQFTVVLLALLTSIGVAGIPAASLVAITIILQAVGVPIEAIGLILVTDRVLDMCRTAVNVFGDSCATVVIARSEGEDTKVALSKNK